MESQIFHQTCDFHQSQKSNASRNWASKWKKQGMSRMGRAVRLRKSAPCLKVFQFHNSKNIVPAGSIPKSSRTSLQPLTNIHNILTPRSPASNGKSNYQKGTITASSRDLRVLSGLLSRSQPLPLLYVRLPSPAHSRVFYLSVLPSPERLTRHLLLY